MIGKRFGFVLRAVTDSDGGGAPPPAHPPDSNPEPPPAPAPPSVPAGPPPPAGTTVVTGTVTEDSAALRKRMDELEETIKDRERECATLTDENHRLKTPPAAPKKPKLIAFPWLRDED